MISPNVFAKTNDTLPHHTHLGLYPLVYFCEDAEPVCPTCVNNMKEFSTEDEPQWNVVDVDINWEEEYLFCASCNQTIDCAYGD
jgi:hypothetical protein